MNKFLSNKMAICLFALPALLIYSVMLVYPIMQTLIKSLYEWDGFTNGTFVFLDNYAELFQDDIFYTSLKNGFIYTAILIVFSIGAPLLMGVIISNPSIKERKFLRTAYFIPVVLSVTVVCQLWQAIYHPQFGMMNQLLTALGMTHQQEWLEQWPQNVIAVAISQCWQQFGYVLLIIYASIKSISEDYYEAASIDGASRYKMHISITLPFLKETIRFLVIIMFTWGFNNFANLFIMTKGGPGTSSYTMPLFIYREGFRNFNFGYGSAVSTVLIAILLIFTLIINRIKADQNLTY